MHEKIEAVLKQPWTIPAAIGVLSFGGGLGLGYFLAKRKFEQDIEVHEFPIQLNMDDDTLWSAAVRPSKVDEIIESRANRPPKVVITEEVAVSKDILKVNDLSQLRPSMLDQNATDDAEDDEEDDEEDAPEEVTTEISSTTNDGDWDYELEIEKRTETAPYVLHQEEFFADEKNYSQITLTYYAVDGILTDEDEKPVYNHHTVTGPLLFGHGSGDPNVVYIRNDERRAEYEVVQLDALYSVEVLGLEIEHNQRVADLKHSKSTKFRMD